jgi:hypothetical protein
MIVYLDNDFRCHIVNDGTMIEYETEFFDGKCDEFIEGYRVVPEGMSWTREDGEVFTGEMISPAVDYIELAMAQAEYEHELLVEYKAALVEAQEYYEEGVNSI